MNFGVGFFLYPFLALVACLAAIPLARMLAVRAGFVDAPGGRKDHEAPVPPIGGLVVIPVFLGMAALAGTVTWPMVAALGVVLAVGALDDRFAIRPRWKFMAQFVAAFLIVLWGDVRVTHLGNLFGLGDFGLGVFSIPFSVIATVLLINAINLMDGLDGLAAGKSFVAFFLMGAVCLWAGEDALAQTFFILCAALIGFLGFNMRHKFRARASVFLGDAGSMALGLLLAWYGMTLGRGDDPILWPISVAWILALPIMDTCAQFARRVAQGRSPFSPDRNHFHHHFVNAGFSVMATTWILMGLGFLTGMVGILGMVLSVPEWILCAGWIVFLLAHIFISLRPTRVRRLFHTLMRRDDAA
jgi:UDP-GlcNAc:undecaprenyl-phosphate GlcNAc-1-phosphate transferase